jgi:hypothetical protein
MLPGGAVAAILVFILMTVCACGAASKVAQTTKKLSPIPLSGGEKHKKIGVMGFDNRVRISFADFAPTADKGLADGLADACPNLLLTLPGTPGYPAFLRIPPRRIDGHIDALGLARRARQQGFNAVVTGGLVDVDGYREERGILWFKERESFVKLLVKMEVFDTRTGAKFVDRLLAREINAEELGTPPAGGSKDIGNPVLVEAVREMAEELAEEICEALEDRPWVGYVTAVSGDRVTLSSGSEQGLAAGDILEVFDSTATIEGTAGERFFQIGPRSGEIKITSVTPDRAEGVATGHVAPGCSVQVK